MPPLPRRAFHRSLRGLSRAAFAAFVADLWAAEGWETTLDDGVVVATREASRPERRVLLCRHDAPWLSRVRSRSVPARADVTGVVTSGAGGRNAGAIAAALDARLVDRDDLYERAVYALGNDRREELFDDYFGGSAGVTGLANVTRDGREVVRGIAAVVALLALVFGVVSVGLPLDGSPPIRSTSPATPVVETSSTAASRPTPTPPSTPTVTGTATAMPTPTPTAVPPDIGFGDDSWPMFRGGPTRAGWNPRTAGPRGPITMLATFSTAGERSRIVSSPAVVDGTLYVGSNGGMVYALGTLSPNDGGTPTRQRFNPDPRGSPRPNGTPHPRPLRRPPV